MKPHYPRLVRTICYLVLLLPLSGLFFSTIPFAPYTELEFSKVPDEVCPNDSVKVIITRDIDDPLLGSLTSAEISSYWEDVKTGDRVGNAKVTLPLSETPEEEVESPVLRESPGSPGTYRIVTQTTAHGYMGFMPRQQTLTTVSPNTTTVLPESAPECKKS